MTRFDRRSLLRATGLLGGSLFLPSLAAANANELLQRLEMCIADHARMVEYVNGTIHAPGLLRQREFSELSKALDHLVA